MKLLLSLAPRPRVLVTLLRAVISAGGNKKKKQHNHNFSGNPSSFMSFAYNVFQKGGFQNPTCGKRIIR